jgi:hypothetical protein
MADQPTGQLFPCPKCDYQVLPNTTRCPQCGYRFSISEAAYLFEKAPQVAREVGRSVATNLPDLVTSAVVFVVVCVVSGLVYLVGFGVLLAILSPSSKSGDAALTPAMVLSGLAAITTALFVCSVVRRRQRERNRPVALRGGLQLGQRVPCPFCRQEVTVGDRLCRHCHEGLYWEA